MKIYSGLLNTNLELDAYDNNYANIIITHKTLVEYIAKMDNVRICYKVIKAELEHAVVQCELSCGQYKCYITEIGETTKETLGKVFANYPVLIAQQMAFDRAVIKFLQFPSNCYSNLEFIRNAQDSLKMNMQAENESDKKSNDSLKGTDKIPLEDYIVDFGIFTGTGLTVKDIFAQAAINIKVHAALNIYLSKNPAEIRERPERHGVIALKRYAHKTGYKITLCY